MNNSRHISSVICSVLLFFLIMGCNSSSVPEKVKLNSATDSVSYVIGLDYGKGIKVQGIEVSEEAIHGGIMDGLAGRSLMNDSVKNRIITDFYSKIQQKTKDDSIKKSSGNIEK